MKPRRLLSAGFVVLTLAIAAVFVFAVWCNGRLNGRSLVAAPETAGASQVSDEIQETRRVAIQGFRKAGYIRDVRTYAPADALHVDVMVHESFFQLPHSEQWHIAETIARHHYRLPDNADLGGGQYVDIFDAHGSHAAGRFDSPNGLTFRE